LEDPSQERAFAISFSPEGALMAVSSADSSAMHVWDLLAIRRNLAVIDLDWDAPPYPVLDLAGSTRSSSTPLQVDLGPFQKSRDRSDERPDVLLERFTALLKDRPQEVEAYHLRALLLDRLERIPEAVADFTRAIELRPTDAQLRAQRARLHGILKQYEAAIADLEQALSLDADQAQARELLIQNCNNRAWELAKGQEPGHGLIRAEALARRAVDMGGSHFVTLNTLGVVQYREGRHAQAIATLERSLAAGRGQADAFDLFFLAMAHHRLGHHQEARDQFDRAVRWLETQNTMPQPQARELAAFRAEAEAVLAGTVRKLPDDVFTP